MPFFIMYSKENQYLTPKFWFSGHFFTDLFQARDTKSYTACHQPGRFGATVWLFRSGSPVTSEFCA